MSIELLCAGVPHKGVLEKIGSPRLPKAVVKYLFCSPNLDFNYRCLPSKGGLYDQHYRDYLEFTIIEARLRDINSRRRQ